MDFIPRAKCIKYKGKAELYIKKYIEKWLKAHAFQSHLCQLINLIFVFVTQYYLSNMVF